METLIYYEKNYGTMEKPYGTIPINMTIRLTKENNCIFLKTKKFSFIMEKPNAIYQKI